MRPTTSALRRRISSKSRAAINSRPAIQLPLIAGTDGCARYSAALSTVTPPLGTKPVPVNGAASASDRAQATELPGREELHDVDAAGDRALHLGRGRGAGQDAHAEFGGPVDERVVEARADDEPRAELDDPLEVARP